MKIGIGSSSFRFSQEVQTHQPTSMATATQTEPTKLRVVLLECWKHMKQNAVRNDSMLNNNDNISYYEFEA
jgi:hypothetical protein